MIPVPCGPTAATNVDAFVTGALGFGSLPNLSADVAPAAPGAGIYPSGFGFMAEHGPQLDLQLVNTNPFSTVQPWLHLNAANAFTAAPLEAGVEIVIGTALAEWGLNTAPGNVEPTTPGVIAGPDTVYDNGAVGAVDWHSGLNNVSTTGLLVPIPALAPGDFIWMSFQTIVRLTGTGGGTVISFGIFGTGVFAEILGVKL